jgi:hypothetical protein
MEIAKEEILLIPIERLELNNESKSSLKSLGINNLQDFIDKGWKWFHDQKNFDYIWFNRVIRILDENGLLHLLEKR